MTERVNHPAHYQSEKMEVIDVIEAFDLNFHMGNAIKYILRAGKKGNRNEDIDKAIWYLQREKTRHVSSGRRALETPCSKGRWRNSNTCLFANCEKKSRKLARFGQKQLYFY